MLRQMDSQLCPKVTQEDASESRSIKEGHIATHQMRDGKASVHWG